MRLSVGLVLELRRTEWPARHVEFDRRNRLGRSDHETRVVASARD